MRTLGLAVFVICIALNTIAALERDQAILPNGMVIKQQYDFKRQHLGNLLASDRRTVIARGVEFLCFNDTYVQVRSFDREQTGIYSKQGGRLVVLPDTRAALETASLWKDGGTCNG